MKLLRTLIVFDQGKIALSTDWQTIYRSYANSIERIDFPEGSGKLKLRRKTRDSEGKWRRNGVGYLKQRFISEMKGLTACRVEAPLRFPKDRTPPKLSLYPDRESHFEPIASIFGGFDLLKRSG